MTTKQIISIMKKYLAVIILLVSLFACTEKDQDDMAGGGNKDNTYFKLTVNGAAKELENIHYARTGKTIHLATWGEGGLPNLNVTLTANSENDFRGNYPYFWDLSAGTSIILYGLGASNGYESHWWDCPTDGPLLMPSPGDVKIENIERINSGEFITGTFNVEQYQPQGNCPYAEVKTIKISAKFRLKRTQ